jgi:hypothetical protein
MHFQNREDLKIFWHAEEEDIQRRAGMESKLFWQVDE